MNKERVKFEVNPRQIIGPVLKEVGKKHRGDFYINDKVYDALENKGVSIDNLDKGTVIDVEIVTLEPNLFCRNKVIKVDIVSISNPNEITKITGLREGKELSSRGYKGFDITAEVVLLEKIEDKIWVTLDYKKEEAKLILKNKMPIESIKTLWYW